MKSKLKSKILTLAMSLCLSGAAYADGWTGQGEAGFVKASGNTDSENINLGLKFANVGEVWTNEIAIAAFQSSNDDIDSAESFSVDYNLKRELSERSNIFFNLNYLDDDFDGFTEQVGAAVGYGYKVILSEPVAWEVGAGIGYRDTSELLELVDGSRVEGEDLSGATFVLRSDYRNQLTPNTQFIDTFKADISSDNTFFQNEAALLVSMNEKFALKAGIIIRHNTDPADGFDETDTITVASLVYNFAK